MRRLALSLASLFVAAVPAGAEDKKAVVRVACVGDSITAGSGYPKALQAILGDGYEVRNYGVSGRTLLNKGDHPYMKEKKYQEALEFKPNVVLIKLGTNDSKAHNWKFAGDFEADLKTLVESFRALESKPKVFLCVPVPAYKDGSNINGTIVKDEVKPKIEAVAKELNLPVIDLHAALSGKPELFPDKVHPNAAGGKLMAEVIAKAVRPDAK